MYKFIKFQQQAESHQVVVLTQLHYNTVCYIPHIVLAMCRQTPTKVREKEFPHPPLFSILCKHLYILCKTVHTQEGIKFYVTGGHKIASMPGANLAHPLACPNEITATGSKQEVNGKENNPSQ